MGLNRFHFLLMLGLAAVMLAGCNSFLANEATEAPAVEQPTPVEVDPPTPLAIAGEEAAAEPATVATEKEPEAVKEELISSSDNISSESEAVQAGSAEDDVPLRLTEEGFVATAPTGKSLQPQLEQANIDLNDVVTLLPPDAIRAVNPEELPEIMVTAAEANEGGLSPDTRVMGASINGESHAYPISFLSRHEIINTELGGRLIAATW